MSGADGRRANDSLRSSSSRAAKAFLEAVVGRMRDTPERPEVNDSGEASRP